MSFTSKIGDVYFARAEKCEDGSIEATILSQIAGLLDYHEDNYLLVLEDMQKQLDYYKVVLARYPNRSGTFKADFTHNITFLTQEIENFKKTYLPEKKG